MKESWSLCDPKFGTFETPGKKCINSPEYELVDTTETMRSGISLHIGKLIPTLLSLEPVNLQSMQHEIVKWRVFHA